MMPAFDSVDFLALLAPALSTQHSLVGRTVRDVALGATG